MVTFCILKGETNWDQAAGVFLKGLSDEIKDELSIRDDNQSLDQLINIAIHLDNRLRERHSFCLSRNFSAS